MPNLSRPRHLKVVGGDDWCLGEESWGVPHRHHDEHPIEEIRALLEGGGPSDGSADSTKQQIEALWRYLDRLTALLTAEKDAEARELERRARTNNILEGILGTDGLDEPVPRVDLSAEQWDALAALIDD